MEFKGTKGEWELLEYYDDFYCIESEDGIVCNTVEKDEIAKADATLIASGLVMLEALQILNGDIERAPIPYTNKEKKEILQNAINKALGK